jgi:hypothetical protein
MKEDKNEFDALLGKLMQTPFMRMRTSGSLHSSLMMTAALTSEAFSF